jgi:hypothetical protein
MPFDSPTLNEASNMNSNASLVLRPCATVLALVLATAVPVRADTVSDQIEQIQAQLESLQRQLDELKAAQRGQPGVAATPAATAKAPEPAPAPAPKPASWSDSTTVGGRLFANVSYIDQTSNGVDTDAKGFGTEVKRGYLVFDHTFDDTWSANITTDFNYSSVDGETQIFIKKAYVQAKLSDEAVFRVGSADMPWNPYGEAFYGFRYIDPTLVDRTKFINTADWGVHFLGKHGMLRYAASVVNGGGYKNPTRSDGVDLEARLGLEPVDGLVFAVGGYSGQRGLDVSSNPARRTAERWDALASYGPSVGASAANTSARTIGTRCAVPSATAPRAGRSGATWAWRRRSTCSRATTAWSRSRTWIRRSRRTTGTSAWNGWCARAYGSLRCTRPTGSRTNAGVPRAWTSTPTSSACTAT